MRSIAVVNQKGGCGKTTTALNLSSCLADMGERVLLIDNDPQSHASMGLGIDTESVACSTYDVYMDPVTRIADAARSVVDNLDIVPSTVILSAVEQQLAGQPERENALRRKIGECNGTYDWVIVDCPPSVGLLTFNALVACDEALVVMEPSFFSLHGAVKAIDTIRVVRDQLGARKRVRLLVTIFDRRTRFNEKFMIDAKDRFGIGLLETVIRRSIRFKEAANRGVSICGHDRFCGGAEDYRQLAAEMLSHEDHLHVDDFDAIAGAKETVPAQAPPEWLGATPGPQIHGRNVIFSLVAPGANSVELVGTFNRWDLGASAPFSHKGNGLWIANVELEPGRHLYKFVVDGQWMPDPANNERLGPNQDCIVDVPLEKVALKPAGDVEAAEGEA